MGDKTRDITGGDEKIEGEERRVGHTDEAEVWTGASVYYSCRNKAFIKKQIGQRSPAHLNSPGF